MRRVWQVVRREPVRVWAYGLLMPVFGVLLVYGVVTEEQAAAWLALGAGIVMVPGAETVRSKVTPTGRGAAVSRVDLTPRVPKDPDPPAPSWPA